MPHADARSHASPRPADRTATIHGRHDRTLRDVIQHHRGPQGTRCATRSTKASGQPDASLRRALRSRLRLCSSAATRTRGTWARVPSTTAAVCSLPGRRCAESARWSRPEKYRARSAPYACCFGCTWLSLVAFSDSLSRDHDRKTDISDHTATRRLGSAARRLTRKTTLQSSLTM